MPTVDPELKYALRMFSRFFDLIHQPLAIINQQGNYVYYNQESAELDGYSIQQALGKHMLDVYPKMKKEQSTMLQSLERGLEYIGNYQIYYNAKGQPVDYQHTTAPLYSSKGEMVGAIEIGRNMSNVRRLQDQVVELNQLLYANHTHKQYKIISQSKSILSLIEKAKRMAISEVPVVIVGETGTGKELFSHLIHRCSQRADKPFIALNCGALPPTLIESTLFGTVKGAFTGAENKKGYLELANGGTLFLDELNAMPIEMQSNLLRFLQDKTFWKIGGNQQICSDVRIIVAMNESPNLLIQHGRLRADLFYRLNVGMLSLPPLRTRPEDIPLLACYFIDKYRADVARDIQGISQEALLELEQHDWPGNVRMLENAIVRSMIMQEKDGPLKEIIFDEEIYSIPLTTKSTTLATISGEMPEGDLTSLLENFERQLIVAALNVANGKIAAAAKRLKISRTTLHYKIKKYEITLGVLQ